MTRLLLDEVHAVAESARGYAGRHQRLPKLTWPHGHRIAVNFTMDFDAMLLRRLKNEPPMQAVRAASVRAAG